MKKAINIIWDLDFEEDKDFLPTEIFIPEEIGENDIEDYISNVTDYCHKGFDIVEVPDEERELNERELWEIARFRAKKEYEENYGDWEEADKYEREDYVWSAYKEIKAEKERK